MIDIERLKEIPIEDICNLYGIKLNRKGKNLWGKIRNEKTSSFSINPYKNIWRDWGLGIGGDSISLIAFLENIDNEQAIPILADKFNIQKCYSSTLPTKNQFKEININADKVISNFVIDFEKQGIEKIQKWCDKYSSISMYDLSKTNLNMYHKILDSRAIPIIYGERNKFFATLNKYKNEDGIEKEIYFSILEELEININKKIDIYNKARLDKYKKIYLKINLQKELTHENMYNSRKTVISCHN